MKSRKGVMAALALLALVLLVRPPSADIRILTHDSEDRSPHRVHAAVDMGVMALSLLVTWTAAQPR
ncbi:MULTISPECIES: hypothetical protein [unclassified Sphingomonas]|jgi:hypothetical protein|uniref:hypothetical protein n=1 Tax=unclassified Sphingomonas TaxID=196159 RepID=UPI00082BB8CA|nr:MULTISPECIES: hypothetical protein [unclassified Sphingomonas]MCH4894217.1 hypothetical protein [Sphingomonas sp. SFZ2018-12]